MSDTKKNKDKLIKVHATWCNPCKKLSRLLDNLNIETEDYDIDTIEGMELARNLEVMSVPVLKYKNDILTDSDEIKVKNWLEERGLL